MQNSATEENYLKAIYKFSSNGELVGTNTLAKSLQTTPASVTDMLKRLSDKALVEYQPYHGVRLLDQGKKIALQIIRKHRLWEVFLVNTLNFSWDEVHETAEQLEHVNSSLLVDKLDEFLGYPKFDPHGDPIPNKDGHFTERATRMLNVCTQGEQVIVAGVTEDAPDFLQYLDRIGMRIGTRIQIVDVISFDRSMILSFGGREVVFGGEFASRILVLPEE